MQIQRSTANIKTAVIGWCEFTATRCPAVVLFRFFGKPQKLLQGGYLCSGGSFGFGRGNGSRLMLGQKLADGLGELCALAGPVVDAITLEVHGGGLGAGVIGADHFDRAAIAGAILFDDNDAIVGLLTGANARQTNHQHRVDPLKKLECIQGRPSTELNEFRGHDRHNRRTRKSEHLSIADFRRFSNG